MTVNNRGRSFIAFQAGPRRTFVSLLSAEALMALDFAAAFEAAGALGVLGAPLSSDDEFSPFDCSLADLRSEVES